jgi:putative hydrolase of the HAD superfamily
MDRRHGLPAPRGRVTTLTFDFWNTLYSADGGTWKEVGPQRMQALREMVVSAGLRPSDDELERVYHAGFDAYMQAWTSGHHFGAREEVRFFLDSFAISAESLEQGVIVRAISEIEEAARLGKLPLVAGVAETIPKLSADGYKLGLISDTSLTPGRVLKEFMERDGLLQHFSVLTFSDETGYCKPDRRMFLQTLAGLGADVAEAAHIGDTPRTDIAGAQSVGMIAVRCAGAMDHPEPPEADFVIHDHRELPKILERLS